MLIDRVACRFRQRIIAFLIHANQQRSAAQVGDIMVLSDISDPESDVPVPLQSHGIDHAAAKTFGDGGGRHSHGRPAHGTNCSGEDRAAAADLSAAYRFLRTLEHRLQMIDDQQTHDLPKTPEGLAQVAAFLGYGVVSWFPSFLIRRCAVALRSPCPSCSSKRRRYRVRAT